MVEYILGIGSIKKEDCEQVMSDVTRRMQKLETAKSAITNELNHLNTIKFQVAQRAKEIYEEEKKNE